MKQIHLSISNHAPKFLGHDPSLPTLALVFADPMQGRFPLEHAYPRFLQHAVGERAHYKYAGVTNQDDLLSAVLKAQKTWPYALTLVHVNNTMKRGDLLALESDLVKHDLAKKVAFVGSELSRPPTETVPSILYKDLEQMQQITHDEICGKYQRCPEQKLSKRLTGAFYSFFFV